MVKNCLPFSFTALHHLVFVLMLAMASLPSVTNASPDTGQIELTPEESAWLEAHPVIRAINDKNYPPYDFYQNGKATGFSVEYLEKPGMKMPFLSGFAMIGPS